MFLFTCFIIDEIIARSVTTAVVRPVTSSTLNESPTANATVSSSGTVISLILIVNDILLAGEFFFNAAYRLTFDEIRGSFTILIDELVPLITQSKATVAEMKSFLQRSFPELSAELSNADSIEGIMNVVVKNCRVNDISIIKVIVLRFHITQAEDLILKYEDKLKTLCTTLKDFLSQNQPQHLNDSNTIQFTLGWEPEEHSLDDIRNLSEEAFKELNKRIIIQTIHRGSN